MAVPIELSYRPNSFGGGELDNLRKDLIAVKESRARLLVARLQLNDVTQDVLDIAASAVLLSNYLFMGSSSGRVVKLIDMVGASQRFNDIQCYGATNYFRALLTGGYAAFSRLEDWCQALGLDGSQNITGMRRFSDIENFLRTCSSQVLSSKDLEVAEAFLSIGHVFDKDARFQPFELTQGSSLRSDIKSGEQELVLRFDQVSDFDKIIIRTTKDRNIIQLDMNITDTQGFLQSFGPASTHLYDLNFMRQYPALDAQKNAIS